LPTWEAKRRESGIEVANMVRPDIHVSLIVVEVVLEASREG